MAAGAQTFQDSALLERIEAQPAETWSLEAWASDPANAALLVSDAWFASGILTVYRSLISGIRSYRSGGNSSTIALDRLVEPAQATEQLFCNLADPETKVRRTTGGS